MQSRVMHDFIYSANPARVIFGAGALRRLAQEVERLGARRALVLCTPRLREMAPGLDFGALQARTGVPLLR